MPVSHYKSDVIGCFFSIAVVPFLRLLHNFRNTLVPKLFITFTKLVLGEIDESKTIACHCIACS